MAEAVMGKRSATSKWSVLLALEEQAGRWVGRALAPGKDNEASRSVFWRYDVEAGLIREKTPAG